jgi:predicted GIY-YIG superfamily endonuclease
LKASPKRYGVKMLVHFEAFADIDLAIEREKTLKKWANLEARSDREIEPAMARSL